jgi:hypothetical protein
MAIKGSYLWRGLDLPEAYVRIVNISGNPREGFHVEFAIFSSPEFAAVAMFPTVLVLVSMFFSSLYFTFRDSFAVDEEPAPTTVDELA